MRADLLRIYLNDHLAGAALGIALMKRCARSNEGTPLGVTLHELIAEVEEDRAVVSALLRRIGGRVNPVKQAGAWVAEKLGRGKINGALVTYSDLSRLEELEGLLLGVRGKRALWEALRAVAAGTDGLGDVDFEALARRADRQAERLEAHRREAARRALLGA